MSITLSKRHTGKNHNNNLIDIAIIRYLTPLLFPVGILVTSAYWENYLVPALGVSLLTSACFVLFLTRIPNLSAQTLMPLMVAVVLIVGYPLKAYIVVSVPWTPDSLGALDRVRWYGQYSLEIIYSAYAMAMLSISAFFLTCFFIMPFLSGTPHQSRWTQHVNRPRLNQALWRVLLLAFAASVAINILAFVLGVGRMGLEPTQLPFRLGGIIVFLQSWLSTNLMFLLLCMGWQMKQKRFVAAVIVALALNSLITTFITASRGALLWWMITATVLAIIVGALQPRKILNMKAVIVLLLLMIAYPVITQYRYLTTIVGRGDFHAIGEALQSTTLMLLQAPLTLFTDTLDTVFGRVMGFENLIILQQIMMIPDIEDARFFILQLGQPIGMYYTREVLGIDTLSYRTIPGTLGSLWLFGGNSVVIWGMALYTLLLFVVRWVVTRGLPLQIGRLSFAVQVAGPATAAIWAVGAMLLTMEGDLIGGTGFLNIEKLVLFTAGMIMTEMSGRIIVRVLARERQSSANEVTDAHPHLVA